MAIESVAFGGAAQQSSSTRNRIERQREERAAPDLYATSVANNRSLIGALGPNATETKRINALIASAKAAAVQLVTQPVETAPTEKVRSVSELLDGVGFNKAARTAQVETGADAETRSPTKAKPPIASAPSSSAPAIPIVSPAPSEAAAPPIIAAPAEPAPSAPSPPAASAPAAPEPTPPPASSTPPASSSPPASTSPSTPPSSTPPSSSGGLGGLIGGLFGRR